MSGEHKSTVMCSVDICFVVTGFYAAFVCGDLRNFDEIDFYIASHLFV